MHAEPTPALFTTSTWPTSAPKQDGIGAREGGGLIDCDGNPGRVGCALGTRHPPCHPRASRGLAQPSRGAALAAQPPGSARVFRLLFIGFSFGSSLDPSARALGVGFHREEASAPPTVEVVLRQIYGLPTKVVTLWASSVALKRALLTVMGGLEARLSVADVTHGVMLQGTTPET